jgi:RNA polymerase sigma-54 factor
MLHLTQTQRLQQKLSPAQVQYLKILQLPVIALEQRIKDEMELNPLLEEGMELEDIQEEAIDTAPEQQPIETPPAAEGVVERDHDELFEIDALSDKAIDTPVEDFVEREIRQNTDEEYSWEEFVDNNEGASQRNWYDEEDDREIPTPSTVTQLERLVEQLHLLDLDERLIRLGEEIIGNIDDDGYLRRNLSDVLMDVNLELGTDFVLAEAEAVLQRIHRLEPIGMGSRDLRECLLVQLESAPIHSTARIIALRILRDCYGHFVKKHFEKIKQELHISDGLLKKAFDVIRHLNPKPGEGNLAAGLNYVIPDFFIARDKDDFVITLNDRGVPPLRVNRAYKELLGRKNNGITMETKKFLRQKMETAKWFIQSINQRRQTMLAVMTTIVNKQREWFELGPGHLRPLIYRDVAEIIKMDISTISRVVNGKYTQTEWGVYELRYFFSEGIPTASGVEISNTEVKNIIKEIILGEDAKKPLSDEALMKMLRAQGFDIARRTVAKYREMLGIPVSRLRTKI